MAKAVLKKKIDAAGRRIVEIDAKGQAVGRVATQVAMALMGKDRPGYVPHLDTGAMVVVKNAGAVIFTGMKFAQKDYKHHTMHPGGLKTVAMAKVFGKSPAEVMRHAVNGMLPKNRRRETLMLRLTIEA